MAGTFYKREPGLTQEQAENLQQRLMHDAKSMQKKVEVSLAGDVNIDPRMMLSLSGTQTAFDQQYYIMVVKHEFSFDGGYRMTVEGKNMDSAQDGSDPSSEGEGSQNSVGEQGGPG